jgi:MoxR-like ATPase
MEERQVTLEGETRKLPRPFLVLATQNPIELEGTFPLPEAQLDRFLMRLSIGYTTETEDETILERYMLHNPIEELEPVLDANDVLQLQQACHQVLVTPDVRQYIIKLVRATRLQPHIELGASPRAMIGLCRTAQALAAIRGRGFVIPDDVKYLAPFVLSHRIIPEASVSLKAAQPEKSFAKSWNPFLRPWKSNLIWSRAREHSQCWEAPGCLSLSCWSLRRQSSDNRPCWW